MVFESRSLKKSMDFNKLTFWLLEVVADIWVSSKIWSDQNNFQSLNRLIWIKSLFYKDNHFNIIFQTKSLILNTEPLELKAFTVPPRDFLRKFQQSKRINSNFFAGNRISPI